MPDWGRVRLAQRSVGGVWAAPPASSTRRRADSLWAWPVAALEAESARGFSGFVVMLMAMRAAFLANSGRADARVGPCSAAFARIDRVGRLFGEVLGIMRGSGIDLAA